MIKSTVTGAGGIEIMLGKIAVSKADWLKVGDGLRRRMQKRISKGKDANGNAFKPYAASTLKKKKRAGKSSTVDMRDTGHMRDQIVVSSDSDGANISLTGGRSKIGYYHQAGKGKNKKREWFGATKENKEKTREHYMRLARKKK